MPIAQVDVFVAYDIRHIWQIVNLIGHFINLIWAFIFQII